MTKKVPTWLVIAIAIIAALYLQGRQHIAHQTELTAVSDEEMKQFSLNYSQARSLINDYLGSTFPSEADLAALLEDKNVKRYGCQILHERMKMPFAMVELKPADVDPAEYRRMFQLMEGLAGSEGVEITAFGQRPGWVISSGLETLLWVYDLLDDLESAVVVYERLKAMRPEDDCYAMARSGGAYQMMKLYGRAGEPEEAEKMRDEMRQLMRPEAREYYTVPSHMQLAKAWALVGRLDRADQYYEQLKASSGHSYRDLALYRLEAIDTLEPAFRQAGNLKRADALRAEAESLLKLPLVERFYQERQGHWSIL